MYGRARQAAELLLVVLDELDVVEDDEDEDEDDGVEEEDVVFDAGVLLDDAPRLSFR